MNFKPIPILLATLGLVTASPAQTPANPPAADPFLKSNKPPVAATPPNAATLPREGLVRMEVFTMSLDDGRALTREFPQQTELYARLGEELEKENPKVKLERLMVLRVRGGQRSDVYEIEEYPYPTEFNPPRIPQSIGIGQPAPGTTTVTITPPSPTPAPPNPPAPPGAKGDPGPPGSPASPLPRPAGSSAPGSVFSPWPYTASTPGSIEFKNTGWSLEIEMTIADDGQTVDLNMAPLYIRLCGQESLSPSGEIIQPVFETSSIATQILTKFGQPTLAGTFSPPVDTGVAGGNMENVTRLLFITVTNPR